MVEPARSAPTNDDRAAFVEAVHEAVAAADAGRTVAYKVVRHWLLSWGTEAEVRPPRLSLVQPITPVRNGRASPRAIE